MTIRVTICMGSSCFARGNEENLRVLEAFVERHGVQAQIQPAGSRCEGICARGPNVRIDGQMHHEVDPGTLIDLLQERTGCRAAADTVEE
jgi:NADH:ubiquinone oxidoreductase subunit E